MTRNIVYASLYDVLNSVCRIFFFKNDLSSFFPEMIMV